MNKHSDPVEKTTPSDVFEVRPVMLKCASTNRWLEASWRLLGVLPGLSQAELSQAEQQGELVMLPELSVHLYPQHCDSYYHNLLASQPKIYLVTQQTEQGIESLLITVDYDEAAAYMETGETVFDAPLPDGLCVWLERFVVQHYQPQLPKKRKRKQWHDEENNGHES